MTTFLCTTNIRVTLYSGFGDWNGGKVPSQSPSGLTDSQAPLGRDTFDTAIARIYDIQYDIGTTNIRVTLVRLAASWPDLRGLLARVLTD